MQASSAYSLLIQLSLDGLCPAATVLLVGWNRQILWQESNPANEMQSHRAIPE